MEAPGHGTFLLQINKSARARFPGQPHLGLLILQQNDFVMVKKLQVRLYLNMKLERNTSRSWQIGISLIY